jgi:hypothetical protein
MEDQLNAVKAGRPSPAMIVAALALVFAMVGTAVAGTDGISSKLTKSKVKSIAKKQATKQLKANVAGSHVNLADTATNATNAGNASTANGVKPSKINYQVDAPGPGTTTIFEGNGLRLTATCPTGGNMTLTATGLVDGGGITWSAINSAGTIDLFGEDESLDNGDAATIVAAADNGNDQLAHIEYANANNVVSIQAYINDSGGINTDCQITGTAHAS